MTRVKQSASEATARYILQARKFVLKSLRTRRIVIAQTATLIASLTALIFVAPPPLDLNPVHFDRDPTLAITVDDAMPLDRVSEWELEQLRSRFGLEMTWVMAETPLLRFTVRSSDDRAGPPFSVQVTGHPDWDLRSNCWDPLDGYVRDIPDENYSAVFEATGTETGFIFQSEGGLSNNGLFLTCRLPSLSFFQESGEYRRYYIPRIQGSIPSESRLPVGTYPNLCLRVEPPLPDGFEAVEPDPREHGGCHLVPPINEGRLIMVTDPYLGTTYNLSLQEARETRNIWAGALIALAVGSAFFLVGAALKWLIALDLDREQSAGPSAPSPSSNGAAEGPEGASISGAHGEAPASSDTPVAEEDNNGHEQDPA